MEDAIKSLDELIALEEQKLKTLKQLRNCLVFRTRSWTVDEWDNYVRGLHNVHPNQQ